MTTLLFMNLNRPLTKHMIETLMDCHERELLKLDPYDAGTVAGANGLINRGMISTKNFTTASGKKITAFYVTSLGIAYLKNVSLKNA